MSVKDANTQSFEAIDNVIGALFPLAQWTTEALQGGMTNRNFRVDLREGERTLRTLVVQEQLPPAYAEKIGIVRENQFEVMRQIEGLGLSPDVLFYDEISRFLVVDFVDGQVMTEVPDRAKAIKQVATLLSRLHSATLGSELEGRVSDPFAGSRWLYEQVRRTQPHYAADYGWVMSALERVEQARGPHVRALCHSDVSPGNVLFTDSSAFLIDWEYVGAGDPFYDLGDFAEKAELNEEEEHLLVQEYCGSQSGAAVALLRVYRFVSMLREGLWSVMAGQAGFVSFDYAGYAAECLARMAEIASDQEFGHNLRLIEASARGGTQPASW